MKLLIITTLILLIGSYLSKDGYNNYPEPDVNNFNISNNNVVSSFPIQNLVDRFAKVVISDNEGSKLNSTIDERLITITEPSLNN